MGDIVYCRLSFSPFRLFPEMITVGKIPPALFPV
jgi:hypothetical protein